MNKIIYALAAAMVICLSMTVYSSETEKDLQQNVMRLHIIANSDSDEDQEVKLKVRNAILESARKTNDAEEFTEIAEKTLKENGFSYGVRSEYGMFPFPEKTYKDMTFPKGDYIGLRLILGDGNGKNWWCVLNPPLCFSEDTQGEMSEEGKTALKASLDKETYEIISKKPEIRLKIVEIANAIAKKAKEKR